MQEIQMASVLITDMIDSCPGNPSIAVTNDWIVRVMPFASDHFALSLIHVEVGPTHATFGSHEMRAMGIEAPLRELFGQQ